MSTIEELTDEQVAEILAGGREKGQYDEDLLAFAQSGKRGVPFAFTGKKAQSVKTGFTQAAARLAKKEDLTEEDKEAIANTVVRVRGDNVFLIRKDLAKKS